MSEANPVPSGLIRGFAEVWRRLAGGVVEEEECAAGRVVIWRGGNGESEALPDRMYGLVEPKLSSVTPQDVPRGLRVHLPPGVVAQGSEPHCLGHVMRASGMDEAWGALRRVGRQGVDKARRLGCRVDPLSDAEYLELARIKAEALGGRAPAPALMGALREVFGVANVHLTGVRWEREPIAAVLSVTVEAYGMLIDGASDRAHWDKNPNNLAVWQAVSSHIKEGCSTVDYGFSPVGAGDARFKDHMGGRATPLHLVVGA